MNENQTEITRRQVVKTLLVGAALGTVSVAYGGGTRNAPTKSAVQFLNHNGIKLAYVDAGKGQRGQQAIVLIHGWSDSHELLELMLGHFSTKYRVFAVDLRGHGQSDKPKTGYAMAQLADEIAWMCDQLKIRKPTIIGHSLGGSIALEIAARHPTLPKSIVAIEGVILPPVEVLEAMKPLGQALKSPAWREAMQGFIASGFLPTDDPALKAYALKELEKIPQHVHIGVYEGTISWDAAAAARACKAPVLYLDVGSGISDLKRFKSLCPQLMDGKTVGLGHSQMVATPQQVNTMIDRFLELGKLSQPEGGR
jgi:pimeloyl-ACP methyl ester carboxylesterase